MLVFTIDNKLFYYGDRIDKEIAEFDDTITIFRYKQSGDKLLIAIVLANDIAFICSYDVEDEFVHHQLDCQSKTLYIIDYLSYSTPPIYNISVICEGEALYANLNTATNEVSSKLVAYDGLIAKSVIPSIGYQSSCYAIMKDPLSGENIVLDIILLNDISMYIDEVTPLDSSDANEEGSELGSDGVAKVSIYDMKLDHIIRFLTEERGYNSDDFLQPLDEDNYDEMKDEFVEKYGIEEVEFTDVLKLQYVEDLEIMLILQVDGILFSPGTSYKFTNIRNFYCDSSTIYMIDYDDNLIVKLYMRKSTKILENAVGLRFPTISGYDLQLGKPRRVRPANR